MSQLSKIPPSALEKLSPEKHKSIVLNELKREDVIAHIAGLLHDVAKLYQIPNWGATESVNLAGWILRNYKYETLETITKVLENPSPLSSERIWRLTPDVIRDWFMVATDRLVSAREEELNNEKRKRIEQEEQQPISEKTQKLVDKFLRRLKQHEDIPYITDPLKTWRWKVISRVAKEYGVTTIEMAARYDKWHKSGTLDSFEDWLLKPEDK